MGEVASRELRNNTRGVLDRVEAGEDVVITVDGRAVARLVPIDRRPRSWTRDEFMRDVLTHRADAGLYDELREMLPDTTDDLRWP
jgi:prevent-host-death family protein